MPTLNTVEALEAEALKPSEPDRSRLFARLAASLMVVDGAAEEEWEQQAQIREAEARSGEVAGVPMEEAMARLRARFPG